MGACASQDLDYSETRISRIIDQKNTEDASTERGVLKLLLLGAGESGKSTLFKQIYQIYGKGFNSDEREGFRTPIYQNIVASIQTLVQTSELTEGYEDWNKTLSGTLAQQRDLILDSQYDIFIDPELADAISNIWKQDCIQETFKLRSQFQIPDNIEYFFDCVQDIAREDYIPSYEDMLRVRLRTTGIQEQNLVIEHNRFRIMDVGGQRNERTKWIHCFEGVTGVMFVAAISEYDQMLFEADDVNRIDEALGLFDEICNSRWFKNTSMILFLNKRDLFEEKIKHIPLTVWDPSYTGPPGDADAACGYLRAEFEAKNASKKKEVYTHICCALDTDLVGHLFTAVKDIVIRRSLRELRLD